MAAAAETALGAVCAACGYAGLRELVAANADYVIDGVCRQLRHLDAHSRSVKQPQPAKPSRQPQAWRWSMRM